MRPSGEGRWPGAPSGLLSIARLRRGGRSHAITTSRLAIGLALLGAAALVPAGACRGPQDAGGGLAVVDDAGDTVRLGRPAERIVSLIPATTELLFALGAGDRLVGRTTWCDYPAQALTIPAVGDGIEPNVERIVARRPDLVVVYRSSRNTLAAHRLQALGLPAVQLRTDGVEDLRRAIRLLGRVTGRDQEAGALLRSFERRLAQVKRDRPRRPSVLLLAWDQPPLVIGRASFLHELVELAGGRNLFEDLETASGPVSLEAIAARDPDVILTTSDAPSFSARPEWQVVRAVRERRFLALAGTEFARPSPRLPDAVRRLARALDSLPQP